MSGARTAASTAAAVVDSSLRLARLLMMSAISEAGSMGRDLLQSRCGSARALRPEIAVLISSRVVGAKVMTTADVRRLRKYMLAIEKG